VWLVFAAGCLGTVEDGPSGSSVGPRPIPTDPSGVPYRPELAGPSQRLDRDALESAVEELLGFRPSPTTRFPAAQQALAPFTSYPSANAIDRNEVETIADAADDIALEAIDRFETILPCAPSAIDEACADAFVDDLAPRALRGSFAPDDADRLKALYRTLRGGADALDPSLAIAGVISAVLQSPGFLYLVERGEPDAPGIRHLTNREIANRLAFLFTSAPPDASLSAAADAGTLADPSVRRTQAERLFDTDAGRRTAARFVREWFGVGVRELPGVADDATASDLFEELDRDVERLVFDRGPGGLAELVAGDRGFVNRRLAMHYGLDAIPAGDGEWTEVVFPAGMRAGLLARGAVAASHAGGVSTSIVRRGHFVRSTLLCEEMPDPPADALDQNPVLAGTPTVREQMDARIRLGSGGCGTCHMRMDPIGIGLEDLDALGRLRTSYSAAPHEGQPVDARGMISGLDGRDLEFDGTEELGAALATSDAFADCLARQWFRFAFGRDEIGGQATPIATALEASGQDLRQAMLSVVESDSFVLRVED
jgi:hypothetical protein